VCKHATGDWLRFGWSGVVSYASHEILAVLCIPCCVGRNRQNKHTTTRYINVYYSCKKVNFIEKIQCPQWVFEDGHQLWCVHLLNMLLLIIVIIIQSPPSGSSIIKWIFCCLWFAWYKFWRWPKKIVFSTDVRVTTIIMIIIC